ncbi:MAG: sortase-like acyltransferase [Pelosinus sp.]|jgi:ribosomal protein S18 acetylase RimI-like enzyme|nr:sortase-like acyltransferase [Pelosinus sp.]
MIKIRRATNIDFDEIWTILHETFLKGDTYVFSPDTSKEEGFHIWMETPLATYVAIENEKIMGTYFIKPNQSGLGSHICNAGYIIASKFRGKGLGRAMCKHSLKEAIIFGFKGMQYNFVVASNHVAVELWKKCGFSIVGRLHNAYNHKEKGYVDAYVMYQWFD